MSVIKIVEVIGTSKKGWEDAANSALKRARRTIKNIKWVEVVKFGATVKDQKLTEYQARLKIAFEVK